MPAALPYQDYITQAAKGDTEFRVNEIEYGNGYGQVLPDGLNNELQTWNLSWGITPVDVMQAIVAAFKAAKGVDYFTWTPFGDTDGAKKFVVRKYTRSALSGDYYEVSAELVQKHYAT